MCCRKFAVFSQTGAFKRIYKCARGGRVRKSTNVLDDAARRVRTSADCDERAAQTAWSWVGKDSAKVCYQGPCPVSEAFKPCVVQGQMTSCLHEACFQKCCPRSPTAKCSIGELN